MSYWSQLKELESKKRSATLAEYYRSARWSELRSERLVLDNDECVLCGSDAEVVHHRRYPSVLGTETMNDLVSLCIHCHHNYHKPVGLEEVIEQVDERIKSGDEFPCPVCRKKCKLYKTSIGGAMAIWMINLVIVYIRNGSEDYVHVGKIIPHGPGGKSSSDGTRLRHWGLAEMKVNDDNPAKNCSGLWRPTESGIKFAYNELAVPAYYLHNNNIPHEFSEKLILISECHKTFNYAETMQKAKLSKYNTTDEG